MHEQLLLGVARKVITPELGTALFGYGDPEKATVVNDDLTLTAYYFRQGEVQALMMSATVCALQLELAEELLGQIQERFAIPRENCLLHTTHTHSGPGMLDTPGWDYINWEYYHEIFVPGVLEAVSEAVKNPVPVTMRVTTGDSFVGVNRREIVQIPETYVVLGQNPWGPFDPKMTVISFADANQKVVANMIHYGCHGTASGKNAEITRDWSGVMTDALEEITGGITAFFNGPEGDIGPRLYNGLTVGGKSARYAMALGGVAAHDACRIWRSAGAYRKADLQAQTFTVQVPLGPRVPLEEAKAKYEEVKTEKVGVLAKQADYYKKVVEAWEKGAPLETRPISQTIIRIGEVAFVAFPYELFTEIGMRIAKYSAVPHALSLSYTNGAEGYFVTRDQICRGGYEVEMFHTSFTQPYADDADDAVVVQTLENLQKMKVQL